jgi:hypothetical protein
VTVSLGRFATVEFSTVPMIFFLAPHPAVVVEHAGAEAGVQSAVVPTALL